MKLIELENLSKEDLKGKVICFPTDTVYGVGCIIDDEEAIAKIYSLKHRDLDKPLACLVPSIDEVKKLVKDIPAIANEFINEYWPGALTIVFNKKDDFNSSAIKGRTTIGLRMPNSKIALAVLNKFGAMATTSVNISNNPPLNDLNEIKNNFGDLIDYYIDDLEECSKVSSTVVDVTVEPYKVLRNGDIKL